jgi:hypothetical protein
MLKWLLLPAPLVVGVGALSAIMMFRARAMRALAVRRGLRYVGPPTLKWWALRKVSPPISIPFSLVRWPNMRSVSNMIEGQQDGVPILIFDCQLGQTRYPYYRTLFACKTSQNPFRTDNSPQSSIQSRGWVLERVGYSHGWIIVDQSPRFIAVPLRLWSMSIRNLDDCFEKLRVASSGQV